MSPLPHGAGLDVDDVNGLVHILGETISTPGGIHHKRRRLMDGLCQLISASYWIWCKAEFDPARKPVLIGMELGGCEKENLTRQIEEKDHPPVNPETHPAIVLLREMGRNDTDGLSPRNASLVLKTATPDGFWQQINVGSILLSQRPLDGDGISGIGVYREYGRPTFSLREQRIAHIVLHEVPWLHLTDFQSPPEAHTLSPRLRTVLDLLIEGWDRKKIADHLGLSLHTIHGYIKEIFRHFNVHSHVELIARFTQGDGGDHIDYSI